uniref:MFS transporter n=1 Tax=Geoglobus ahangari TaxID=113653 RepID=A0A7C3YEX7_9EURY
MVSRWVYLLCGFLINLMLGVIYSWSVFIGPLESVFGWTRALTSGAFTLVIAFFAVGMLPAGALLAKWGPKKVVWLGGILLALGWILTSAAGVFATDEFFTDPTSKQFLNKELYFDSITIPNKFKDPLKITVNGEQVVIPPGDSRTFTDAKIVVDSKPVLESIVYGRGSGFNMNALYWLYLTYGIIGGLGIGFAYNVPIPIARRWFPDRAGLAVGIAVMGFGLGALFLAPAAVALIYSAGWANAFLYLGIIFLIVVCGAGSILRFPPEGWKPEGWVPPAPTTEAKAKVYVAPKDYVWREMIKTKQFWMLWLWYWFMAAAGLLTIGHIGIVAKEYGADIPMLGTTAGVVAVGMLSLFNGFGRPGFGYLSDRYGRRPALLLDAGIMTVMMFVFLPLVIATGVAGVFLAVILVGLAYGGVLALMPTLNADFFGTKNLGFNYAVHFTAWGAAGLIGPQLAGFIRDATGGYEAAYVVSGIMCLIALIISFILKPPKVE